MPERSLLNILARTAHWGDWWRRIGPASGATQAGGLLRNVLTTSAYGCPLGPTQAARHIRGVSAHELGATANPHFSIDKLNPAIVDVINAYLGLDLVKGGSSVAADGTQLDTLIDNLAFAERLVRTAGEECLDLLLVVSRRHLEVVLSDYVRHYNDAQPHRGLGLERLRRQPAPASADGRVIRRDILGGLVMSTSGPPEPAHGSRRRIHAASPEVHRAQVT